MSDSQTRKRFDDKDSTTKISLQSMENNLSNSSDKIKEVHSKHASFAWWYEDRSSVLLLFFLYILQGIPLGLAGSIPMLLAVSFSSD